MDELRLAVARAWWLGTRMLRLATVALITAVLVGGPVALVAWAVHARTLGVMVAPGLALLRIGAGASIFSYARAWQWSRTTLTGFFAGLPRRATPPIPVATIVTSSATARRGS